MFSLNWYMYQKTLHYNKCIYLHLGDTVSATTRSEPGHPAVRSRQKSKEYYCAPLTLLCSDYFTYHDHYSIYKEQRKFFYNYIIISYDIIDRKIIDIYTH